MAAIAIAIAVLVAGVLAMAFTGSGRAPQAMQDQRIGLMTSLPIYRAPSASVAEALSAEQADPHWLRALLEDDNRLEPLDLLDPEALSGIDTLMLVQPRALTPAENVALDDWVRAGGHVLLVADPMLVGEPPFALGDPRNPQAIAVTGPIHARWGLTLRSDAHEGHTHDQGHRHGSGMVGDMPEKTVRLGDASLPVALGGTFALRPPEGGDPVDCALVEQGLIASCTIGKGRAVLLADATLFERPVAGREAPTALWALLGMMRDEPAR